MRNAIKEYLELSKTEKEELWENAVFVFDTNIFLNLYRYTEVTRNSLFKAMQQLSDRVWMPRQVSQELMKDRAKVIFDTLKIFDELSEEKEKFITTCKEKLRRENKDPKIDSMSKEIDKHIKNLMKESNYVKSVDDDQILNQLLKIFENKVGIGFSEPELEMIRKEGGERYNKQIPPGYKDYKKGEENNAFGDLIIWKEILQYSADNKKDIIYVTGDQKEDWWNRTNGRTLGPRVELRKEFVEKTNRQFHMYSMNGFLTHFRKMEGTLIQQSAIDEVKNYEKKINEQYQILKRQEWIRRRFEENESKRCDLETLLNEINEKQEFTERFIKAFGQKAKLLEALPDKDVNDFEKLQKYILELNQNQSYLHELLERKNDIQNKLDQIAMSQENLIEFDIAQSKELALID